MAEPRDKQGDQQALVATFSFGTVAIAAVGAGALYLRRGCALPFFRDGPRLVLAAFLASSFIWALVLFFIATLASTDQTSACQTAIAIASAFDQIARILLEEFLFWAIDNDVKASAGVLVPQAVFLLRFILGGVFVGVQRPQFKPICVTLTLVLPLAVAVLVADAFIVLMLMTRASSAGIFRDLQEKTPNQAKSKALLLLLLALASWIVLSVPMILGMESFDLIVRTMLPALGSLTVIGLVAALRRILRNAGVRSVSSHPPMADAPADSFGGPPAGGLQARNMSPLGSSESAKPFAIATTDTRGTAAAPSHLRRDQVAPSRGGHDGGLPVISRPRPGQAEAGVGGLPVAGQLFPPVRAQTAPMSTQSSESTRPVKKAPTTKGGKLVISRPILNKDAMRGSLDKIATIDLATAARKERERRDMHPRPLTSHSVDSVQTMSRREERSQSRVSKRKEVGTSLASVADDHKQLLLSPAAAATKGPSEAVASSSPPSPGADELRRRSPHQASQTMGQGFPSAVAPPPPKDVEEPAVGISRASTAPATMAPDAPPQPPGSTAQGPKAGTVPKQRARSSSASSLPSPTTPRRSRAGTTIFTDPNRPPSIPRQYVLPPESVDVLVPQVPPLPREGLPSLHGVPGIHQQTRGPLASHSVRSDIRPSRQRPASPSPPQEEDKKPKTPVQLRLTNGIPGNPRARTMRAVPRGAADAREGTAMFANGIENDDPKALQGAAGRASGSVAKKPPSVDASGRESVLHRPRPVPRRSTAKASPRSDFSSVQRNSRNRAEASQGQPSRAPRSAGMAPPSMRLAMAGPSLPPPAPGASRRRSMSLPDLPNLPPPPPPKEAEGAAKPSAVGVSTGDGTTRGRAGPGADSSSAPGPRPPRSANKYVSTFSVDTTVSSLDDWQAGSPPAYPSPRAGSKRQSSPVLPIGDQHHSPAPDKAEETTQGENDGGSRRMPPSAAAQTLEAGSPSAAVSGTPTRPTRNASRVADSGPSTEEDDNMEMMTVMLDQSAEPQADQSAEPQAKDPEGQAQTGPDRASWHHRVGDECPTFSDRKSTTVKTRNASWLPPPPLPLSKPTRRTQAPKTVCAELSPLETPRDALDRIQEQLKRLDEAEETAANDQRQEEQQRMTLLADLEMEMGMQENRWQKLRQDIARTSVSTSMSSPLTNPSTASLEHSPVVEAATGHDVAVSAASAGLPLILDHGDGRQEIFLTVDDGTLVTPRAGNSTTLHSDIDDSEDRGQPDKQSGPEQVAESAFAGPALGLAIFNTSSSSSPRHLIQSPAAAAAIQPLPGSTFTLERPVTRKSPGLLTDEAPVPQGSSPTVTKAQFSPTGLGSEEPQAQQPAVRPRTMRPPRRNRRNPSLPDILENPEPLVDKRGTLGLFQFPWGEKSDCATVPLQMQMRMGMGAYGNMMPGYPPAYPTLDAQVRTQQSQDYPSSFFDDYDDDESGDDDDQADVSDEDENNDEDDSFDEATLWEIASLLKTDKVPSWGSLFPEYAEGMDEATRMVLAGSAEVPELEADGESTLEPFVVAFDRETPRPTLPSPAKLWIDKSRYAAMERSTWLPQPEPKRWETYLTAVSRGRRTTLRKHRAATTTMWTPTTVSSSGSGKGAANSVVEEALPMTLGVATCLWAATPAAVKGEWPRSITQGETTVTTPRLWMAPAAVRAGKPQQHLCQSHDKARDRRTDTFAEPATPGPRSSPRTAQKPPAPPLESSSPCSRHALTHHDWASLSAARPGTPGAMSTASGSASPFSDDSSVCSTVSGLSTDGSLPLTGCTDDVVARPHDGHWHSPRRALAARGAAAAAAAGSSTRAAGVDAASDPADLDAGAESDEFA